MAKLIHLGTWYAHVRNEDDMFYRYRVLASTKQEALSRLYAYTQKMIGRYEVTYISRIKYNESDPSGYYWSILSTRSTIKHPLLSWLS
jgi:hypothetical protein